MELHLAFRPAEVFRAHRLHSRRNLGGAVRSVDSIVRPRHPLTDDWGESAFRGATSTWRTISVRDTWRRPGRNSVCAPGRRDGPVTRFSDASARTDEQRHALQPTVSLRYHAATGNPFTSNPYVRHAIRLAAFAQNETAYQTAGPQPSTSTSLRAHFCGRDAPVKALGGQRHCRSLCRARVSKVATCHSDVAWVPKRTRP